MKISSSNTSVGNLATLMLAILAVLTVFNANIAYASPIITSKNLELNAQVTPHVPASAEDAQPEHYKRADGHQDEDKYKSYPAPWHYKRADEHGDENKYRKNPSPWHYKRSDEHGDENKYRKNPSPWHYKRADEHRDENKYRKNPSPWHYK
jgi:hypothetical protein